MLTAGIYLILTANMVPSMLLGERYNCISKCILLASDCVNFLGEINDNT